MQIELVFKIINDNVEISAPQFAVNLKATGLVVLSQDRNLVIDIGSTEESFKKQFTESSAKINEDGIKKLLKDSKPTIKAGIQSLSDVENVIRRQIELCKNDLLNNTYIGWEEAKDNFSFIYPFSIDHFNSPIIINFLQFFSHKITYEYFRQGTIGQIISFFLDKYTYQLWIDGYENASIEARIELEKSLLNSKKLIKAKGIFINGNQITPKSIKQLTSSY